MKAIYHITDQNQLDNKPPEAGYIPAAYEADGFIHCSFKEQLPNTLQRHFEGADELILLTLDREKITSEIREENTSGGSEPFPHIYGSIPKEAVISSDELKRDNSGEFDLTFLK